MVVLRYMDDKTCKTCERTMDIDEGLKTCKMCLPDKRTNYHKHKHKRNEVQRKKVKKMRNIEK
jgi:hypothetical protein